MVPFVPYLMQRRVIDLVSHHRGAVIVKTRQLGMTEAIASWFLKKATENPAYAAVVFSKNQEDTSNVSRRVSLMAATAQIELAHDAATRIETGIGAQLFFRPSTDNAARSLESIHDLLFDEAGFARNVAKIYGAASPAQNILGADARTIFISTPNGKQGFFWELLSQNNPDGVDIVRICQGVRDGTLYCDEIPGFYWFVDLSGWVKIFIHWRSHPVYSQMPDYLEMVRQRDKLDDATLAREHHLGFEDSESQVFNSELVDCALRGSWAPPTRGRRYLMAVDTNLGGADSFVAGVLDVTTPVVSLVGWYRDARRSTDYNLHKLLALWDAYRPQQMVIETNNGGQIYLEQMVLKRPGAVVTGVNTNRNTKPVHIGRLNLLLEREGLELPPESVIRDEFMGFMRNVDGSMMASAGNTDDIVMMLAIAMSEIEVGPLMGLVQPQPGGIKNVRGIFG